jgi:hypothetical protein
MLEEFSLEAFLVYFFVGAHHPSCLPNVSLTEGGGMKRGVTGIWVRDCLDNVIKRGYVREHQTIQV